MMSNLYSIITSVFNEWKNEFKITTITFFVTVLAGLLLFSSFFREPASFNELIDAAFGDLIDQDINFKNMFFAIFQRNFTISLFTILLGLLYKYLPLALVIINGFLIGIISSGMISLGFSPIFLLQNLLPHGVFEIPAFLFASAIGIKLSNKAQPNNFFQRLQELINLKYAIFLVVMLLSIAAAIESYLIVINA